jgi:predicted MFS family arabinose efflux permease
MGATAQGMFSAISMGLASALGAMAGGWMFDALGAPWLFRCGAALVVLALAFFLATHRAAPQAEV